MRGELKRGGLRLVHSERRTVICGMKERSKQVRLEIDKLLECEKLNELESRVCEFFEKLSDDAESVIKSFKANYAQLSQGVVINDHLTGTQMYDNLIARGLDDIDIAFMVLEFCDKEVSASGIQDNEIASFVVTPTPMFEIDTVPEGNLEKIAGMAANLDTSPGEMTFDDLKQSYMEVYGRCLDRVIWVLDAKQFLEYANKTVLEDSDKIAI